MEGSMHLSEKSWKSIMLEDVQVGLFSFIIVLLVQALHLFCFVFEKTNVSMPIIRKLFILQGYKYLKIIYLYFLDKRNSVLCYKSYSYSTGNCGLPHSKFYICYFGIILLIYTGISREIDSQHTFWYSGPYSHSNPFP